MDDKYIDERNTIERRIISRFLLEMLDNALENKFGGTSLSNYERQRITKFYQLLLSTYVDSPLLRRGDRAIDYDFVSALADIAHSGENGYIHLGSRAPEYTVNEFLAEGIDIFIPYDSLRKILPEISTTLNFYYTSVSSIRSSTINPNYRLVFDYIWGALSEKILNAYYRIYNMFFDENGQFRNEIINIADSNRIWELVFYYETGEGVKSRAYSKLSRNVIPFDVKDPIQVHKAIVNLLLYTLMYPRSFGVIRITRWQKFLYYDAYGLYSHEYVQSSTGTRALGGASSTHFWDKTGGFFTKEQYNIFVNEIRENYWGLYIGPEDIRNFLQFHPSRDTGDENIIYYMMDKFFDLFVLQFGRDSFPTIFIEDLQA